MRPFVIALTVILVAGALAQSEAPTPVSPIEPAFPADLLAKIHGRHRIELFIEVDAAGRVKGVEAFGPWVTCGKTDPVAEALKGIAVEATRRAAFFPGRRLGRAAEAPRLDTIWLEGTAKLAPVTTLPASGPLVNGVAVSIPLPKYPDKARKYRLQGAVPIRVLIDEEGRPISASAKDGHPLLLIAAARAACEARFTPTTIGGHALKVGASINYRFVP